MKNKSLALIMICLLGSATITAQVIHEKTYLGTAETADLENNGYKYFVTDYLNNSVQIYNGDHSPWKNISIPVPLNEYLYDVAYVSSKVFHTDDLIEMLVVTYRYVTLTDTSGYYVYSTLVVNENGSVLMNQPGGAYSFTFTDNNNKRKLVTYVYDYSISEYIMSTEVFSLPDKTTGIMTPGTSQMNAYPNPSKDGINLPYEVDGTANQATMVVTDIYGREYSSFQVSGNRGVLQFSTKNLPSGHYLYFLKVHGKMIPAGKFSKE